MRPVPREPITPFIPCKPATANTPFVPAKPPTFYALEDLVDDRGRLLKPLKAAFGKRNGQWTVNVLNAESNHWVGMDVLTFDNADAADHRTRYLNGEPPALTLVKN